MGRTYEQRQELVAVARELITELQKITRPVNELCCKLDSEIQQMLPQALREQEDSGDIIEAKTFLRGTGKRACSICRLPGHRATSCPKKGK